MEVLKRIASAVCDPLSIPRKVRWRVIEARWNFLGYDYVALCPGVRMRIVASSVLGRMLRAGGYEENERSFVQGIVRPGDAVVDVGANDGLFTLICAAMVGPSGLVVSFEPAREAFNRLRRNVRINGFNDRAKLLNQGLSNESGEAVMHISLSGYDAWNSIAGELVEGEFRTEVIRVSKWDDIATGELKAVPISLMKIDVEGWEIPVLRGARQSLSSPDAPILQVEFTVDNARTAGFSTEELFRFVQNLGYRQFLYEDSRLVEIGREPDQPYCNVYALKESAGHFDRVRDAGMQIVHL